MTKLSNLAKHTSLTDKEITDLVIKTIYDSRPNTRTVAQDPKEIEEMKKEKDDIEAKLKKDLEADIGKYNDAFKNTLKEITGYESRI